MHKKISQLLKKIAESYDEVTTKQKDFICDAVTDYLKQDLLEDKMVLEALRKDCASFGKNWTVYFSRDLRDNCIVKNIKGRGFVDFDEVLKKLCKKMKLSESEVRENFNENIADHMFWERVEGIVRALRIDQPDFCIVGRSGGYWGLPIKSEMIEIDQNKLETLIEKSIKNFKFKYDKIDVDVDDIISDLCGMFKGGKYAKELDDLFMVNDKWSKILKELDKYIEANIKQNEDADFWVEQILNDDQESKN